MHVLLVFLKINCNVQNNDFVESVRRERERETGKDFVVPLIFVIHVWPSVARILYTYRYIYIMVSYAHPES